MKPTQLPPSATSPSRLPKHEESPAVARRALKDRLDELILHLAAELGRPLIDAAMTERPNGAYRRMLLQDNGDETFTTIAGAPSAKKLAMTVEGLLAGLRLGRRPENCVGAPVLASAPEAAPSPAEKALGWPEPATAPTAPAPSRPPAAPAPPPPSAPPPPLVEPEPLPAARAQGRLYQDDGVDTELDPF